ncbi:hypothetical protein cyc_01239 [Cyclospora cayetanensis]|uniref:Structural maintenance of chromosomes protein 5 n=1 Tax=Cyclospora cayetanensis TaxID=88456 RepID=A0A1D3D1W2_9EIME|nr:hypothetical protein cyc_01239 [Cyclospora cayetanensis]
MDSVSTSREAPLTSTPNGGPHGAIPLEEFGTGQLISMRLMGFMAFKCHVEIYFSPYTNLIASCNGVGKSTIVSAIQFALGCRISSGSLSAAAGGGTQHHQQSQQPLQRYLTYGGSKASVRLNLKGTEENEVVSIQRDLDKTETGIKSTYLINGAESRLSDVQRERERLSIRADNYLCFMQQEKVSIFGSLTPKELLLSTLQLLAVEALEGYKLAKGHLQEASAALKPRVQELQSKKEGLQKKKEALQHKAQALKAQVADTTQCSTSAREALEAIDAKMQADEEAAEQLDTYPAQLQTLMRRLQLQREKALDPHAQRLMLEETLQQLLKTREEKQQRLPRQSEHFQLSRNAAKKEEMPLPSNPEETKRLLHQQNQKMLTTIEVGFDVGSVRRGTELLRTTRFRASVEGPLGVIVSVTDSRAHLIADHFLRSKLLSFLCLDAEEDFLIVSRANLRCFALNPSASVGRRPRLTPALRAAGVEGFLMDFLSVPAPFAATFQEYTMAHLCLICRPDLSPQQEERMQQVAKQELRQQGCPSQEIVYYLGTQAHRLKQSAYDVLPLVELLCRPCMQAPLPLISSASSACFAVAFFASAQLEDEQKKLSELREATAQQRDVYGEAKKAVESWKREAASVYRELLQVLPSAGAVASAPGTAEEEATVQALLAADTGSGSSSSIDAGCSGDLARGLRLPPLPPLPDSLAALEAEEERLKLRISRGSRVSISAATELSKTAAEMLDLSRGIQQAQRDAKALHQHIQEQADRWLPKVERVVSVLCDRFKSLMRAVSPKADGRIALLDTTPQGVVTANKAAPAAAAGATAAPKEARAPEALQLDPLPDFGSMRLLLQISFGKTVPLRQLSNTNSGGERSLVAVLYLLAVQAFAQGSFRVLDEINQGLDSEREALLFRLLSDVAHGRHATSAPGLCRGAAGLASAAGASGSSSRKRRCTSQDRGDTKRARAENRAALKGAEHEPESENDSPHQEQQLEHTEHEGGVQYILLTPHVIPKVNLSSIALQFIFNGPGRFAQEQFDLQDQIGRLKARRGKVVL